MTSPHLGSPFAHELIVLRSFQPLRRQLRVGEGKDNSRPYVRAEVLVYVVVQLQGRVAGRGCQSRRTAAADDGRAVLCATMSRESTSDRETRTTIAEPL